VAALIRRFHEAKVSGAREVVVWGTGTSRREFLYVDDLADACIHLMKSYSSSELVNVGTGEDIHDRRIRPRGRGDGRLCRPDQF
jgi:GDP-L-fucose synthase